MIKKEYVVSALMVILELVTVYNIRKNGINFGYNNMKNLKKIIQKANPEKKWNYTQIYPTHDVHACNMCKTGIGEYKKEVSITIADVLLAMSKRKEWGIGGWISWDDQNIKWLLQLWNLKKDLDNQSQPTKDFLKKLLCTT